MRPLFSWLTAQRSTGRMLTHPIARRQLPEMGSPVMDGSKRFEGGLYGGGAVFQDIEGPRPVRMVRGFENEMVGPFGDAQGCRRGANKFVIQKYFCAVGFGGDSREAEA